MKTAMQTLIDKLNENVISCEETAKGLESRGMTNSAYSSLAMAHAYKVAIKEATELLESEKQNIVYAYEHEHTLVKFPEFEDGETYYNNLLTK